MAEKESRYKAYEIVNYLCGLLRKAGSEQIKLPGESSLARQFSVSRGTIQRAMEGIIARELVVKKAGKQGYYSNPVLSSQIPRCVGVLVDDGKEIFTPSEAHILGNFMKGIMEGKKEEYYFHHLRREDLKVLESSLAVYGIDSLLWLSTPPEYISKFNALVKRNYPAVSVLYCYNSCYPFPESNTIVTAGSRIAELLLQEVLSTGWENMVYSGYRGVNFRKFRKDLEEKGGFLKEENIIEKPSCLKEKLAKILKKESVACIFSDGDHNRYRPICELLASRKKYWKIPFFLFQNSSSLLLAEQYPFLDFRFFEKGVITRQIREKAGFVAAEALEKMEKTEKKIFPNIFMEPEI